MGKVWDRRLPWAWKGQGPHDYYRLHQFRARSSRRFPVNSPDCMVLDQSVNHTWKNLKGRLNEKFQKRKPRRRTNGGFVNDVLSSWEEMKIEHIQNAIDIQKEVMLEIIERQGGQLCFSAQILRANREKLYEFVL